MSRWATMSWTLLSISNQMLSSLMPFKRLTIKFTLVMITRQCNHNQRMVSDLKMMGIRITIRSMKKEKARDNTNSTKRTGVKMSTSGMI
jgi:hypothetical protein